MRVVARALRLIFFRANLRRGGVLRVFGKVGCQRGLLCHSCLALGSLARLVFLFAACTLILCHFLKLLNGHIVALHRCGKLVAVHQLVFEKEFGNKIKLAAVFAEHALRGFKALVKQRLDLLVNEGRRFG